jgi:hypothetical protein
MAAFDKSRSRFHNGGMSNPKRYLVATKGANGVIENFPMKSWLRSTSSSGRQLTEFRPSDAAIILYWYLEKLE